MEDLSQVVERLRARARTVDSMDGSRADRRPELDVGLLMQRVRADIDPRQPGDFGLPARSLGTSGIPGSATSLPRAPGPADPIGIRKAYGLGELLAFNDEDFVRNAFRALLHREPDLDGFSSFLEDLRNGVHTKVEILGALQDSMEGRREKVQVAGLARALLVRRWRRIPVLGSVIGIIESVLRLPTMVRSLEHQEVLLFRRERQLRAAFDALAVSSETALNSLSRRSAATGEVHCDMLRQLVSMRAEMSKIQAELALGATVEEATSIAGSALAAVSALKGGVAELDRRKADAKEVALRLDAAERTLAAKADAGEVANRFTEMFSRGHIEAVLRQGDPGLDDFYVEFEDRFRGTREDIKGRVAVYLPIVRESGAGTPEFPILDVGCGRGEWLELLRESGLVARGLDLNPVMAGKCRALGLDVTEAEVIEYLRTLEPGCLGAITGMHLIEHLPFQRLVLLFDEALRALRPGGVAIFETPNPENMIVGSCNFWYDPTHVHPLPPEGTRFVAQSRGFSRVELLRLHPYPIEAQLHGGGKEMRERLNAFLFGPQDYSVLAFKDAGNK